MALTNSTSELQLRMSGLVIRDERREIVRQRNNKEENRDGFNILRSICLHFIEDMNKFGIAVLDSFLGNERGDLVFDEVINLHRAGLFTDGQLVRNVDTKNKDIRGDEILWLVGNESSCPNIRGLINDIDSIVREAGRYGNNGLLGKYKIDSRTKAMVACYPGNGAHYVKHVDNPNKDGRVLTAIYYLNKNWDSKVHGGVLRIFPTEERPQAAEIDPNFDRMLFFWSDRRNPHEVRPSFRTRYAITIWYLDATERRAPGYRKESNSDDGRKSKLDKTSIKEKVQTESAVKENVVLSQLKSSKTTKSDG